MSAVAATLLGFGIAALLIVGGNLIEWWHTGTSGFHRMGWIKDDEDEDSA